MNNNVNVLPFIFGRLTQGSQETIQRGGTPVVKDWIVVIAHCGFTIYNCGWMDHDGMGNYCLAPDVDITVEEDHVFSDFTSAREFVKQWWISN